MKKLAFALLILLSPGYLYANDNTAENVDTWNADFEEDLFTNYASIVFDAGLQFLYNPPKNMQAQFGSHTLNGSLYYNIPIKESHFMISPGIGVFSETYSLKDNYTLSRDKDSRHTKVVKANTLITGSPSINSANFNAKYVDLITELRFNTNRLEPQDGFFIAIGGKLGLRWSASTTIAYREDDQNKTRTTEESFNLNRLHYGVIARVGWGRFGAFYSHTLSSLFGEKGPSKAKILPFNAGLSFNFL